MSGELVRNFHQTGLDFLINEFSDEDLRVVCEAHAQLLSWSYSQSYSHEHFFYAGNHVEEYCPEFEKVKHLCIGVSRLEGIQYFPSLIVLEIPKSRRYSDLPLPESFSLSLNTVFLYELPRKHVKRVLNRCENLRHLAITHSIHDSNTLAIEIVWILKSLRFLRSLSLYFRCRPSFERKNEFVETVVNALQTFGRKAAKNIAVSFDFPINATQITALVEIENVSVLTAQCIIDNEEMATNFKRLFSVVSRKKTLVGFNNRAEDEFLNIIDKNRTFQKRKRLHDICISLSTYNLPAYVFSWIVDFLWEFCMLSEKCKVEEMQGCISRIMHIKNEILKD